MGIVGIQCGTVQQTGSTSVSDQRLFNCFDYKVIGPQSDYKKWCNVDLWSKENGYDFISTNDDYPIENHRATYFKFDLLGFPQTPGTIGYYEIKYYIHFKDRKYT